MHLPDRKAELPAVLNESPSLGTEACLPQAMLVL